MEKPVDIVDTLVTETMEPNMNYPKKSPVSQKPRKLEFVRGTKSISNSAADYLYDIFSERIEREGSVSLWSYVRRDNKLTIKIGFKDEDTVLDVRVDSLNMRELQKAIETVDAFFVRKSQRS